MYVYIYIILIDKKILFIVFNEKFLFFFTILFLSIGIASTFLTASFFQRFEASRGEYYFLLLSAVFGLILIRKHVFLKKDRFLSDSVIYKEI